jgi:hypothetical protein
LCRSHDCQYQQQQEGELAWHIRTSRDSGWFHGSIISLASAILNSWTMNRPRY